MRFRRHAQLEFDAFAGPVGHFAARACGTAAFAVAS